MPLNIYGENGFTVLFFQAVNQHNRLRQVLSELKPFAGKGRIDLSPDPADDEIWLFPNFGKRYGFGEPDALVLAESCSFWFEVETRINFQTHRSGVDSALLQLCRFHFLNQAIAVGPQVRKNVGPDHLVLMGETVTNNWKVREAVLRTRDHKVLQRILDKLRAASPHYVLLAHAKMKGPRAGRGIMQPLTAALSRTCGAYKAAFEQWAEETDAATEASKLNDLQPERCWYGYWKGHLNKLFQDVENPLAGYVEP